MDAKKIRLLSLSGLLVLGLGTGLVSCQNGNEVSVDETVWNETEEKVFFERRLWSKSNADQINIDDPENKWEYKSANSNTFQITSSDGSVRLRTNGDSITTEKFSTKKPFSVDITMSLNGGRKFPSGLNLEKGDLVLVVEALDSNNRVVSKRTIDDPSVLPQEKSVDVIRVMLNSEKKSVSRVRIRLEKAYFKNYIEINIGIGRVKVYQGKQTDTTILDGVESEYVSNVTYTNNKAENYEELPTSGIRLSDVRKSSYDLKSLGDKKILVIPVRFTDTDESKLHVYNSSDNPGEKLIDAKYLGGYDGMRKTIEQAYFGVSDETGWESLSSYYYKSSGGKLNITGKVSEWFTYDNTVEGFYKEAEGASSVYNLVVAACQWYKENFDDYAQFDQDGDGYFDCVEFVYAQPNCNSNTIGVCNKKKYPNSADLFWAFCWKRSGVEGIKNWPTPYTFAWFSYDFLYNNFNSTYFEKNGEDYTSLKADTHTVIHENGHALGLVDYYSTGYDGSSPLSGIDMMDNNVGDHNSYSKWQFDWYGPKEQVIYDENDETTKHYEVTLRPFESSGDFAIIPAYNREELNSGTNPGKLDSSYSEFITLEYYTPTGLNKLDSEENYQYASGAKCMTEAGLKMLHVDSRLAYLSSSSSSGEIIFNDYLPVNASKSLLDISSSSSRYIDLAHRNDATEQNYDTGSSKERDYRLISSLFANGLEDKKTNKIHLSNEHLWGSKTSKVMDFGITNHENFVFNNGYQNVYSVQIEEMTDEYIKLSFDYIEKQ